jgi:hypothetical protein
VIVAKVKLHALIHLRLDLRGESLDVKPNVTAAVIGKSKTSRVKKSLDRVLLHHALHYRRFVPKERRSITSSTSIIREGGSVEAIVCAAPRH